MTDPSQRETALKPLIVLEMANNHMGDIAHGQAMIRAFGDVVKPYAPWFDFAFKLQYRDLDSFIHPAAKGRADVKYVKRFEETRLSDAQFLALIGTMRDEGFRVICTPFDEVSVGKIVAHGIDTIKIASCSCTDWPLLEAIAATDKPIIASTAAARLSDIDAVVSFFSNRKKDLTILHCVGEYPTPAANLNIGQVELLRRRYPDIKIGFSTHEAPAETDAVKIALALGAVVLEKHVGLPTESYPLNAYSCSPQQFAAWLQAARSAVEMIGARDRRYAPSQTEVESLLSLKRGVYARQALPAGAVLRQEHVFFAFPPQPGQLTANDWSKYSRYVLKHGVAAQEAIMQPAVEVTQLRERIFAIVQKTKQMLAEAHVVPSGKSELEVSHHYGIDKFDQYGLVMVNVVNRAYCKKILVLMPGQTHPEQYHREKEETFIVLRGEMTLKLDGAPQIVRRGDIVTVERGVRHEFSTEAGVVMEEISSTHFKEDSFYTDPAIAANKDRKTYLSFWI